MTPETLTCDKCGAKMRIETDDQECMDKKKAEFLKEHKKCQKHDTR
jgi:hypothetical protein